MPYAICHTPIMSFNAILLLQSCLLITLLFCDYQRAQDLFLDSSRPQVCVIIIGVVSVVSQYNCVYYCDTYIILYTHLDSSRPQVGDIIRLSVSCMLYAVCV
jgi:hypothetical protein